MFEFWLHDEALVIARDTDVVARSRATGELLWTVKPPTDVPSIGRPLFCSASTTISEHVVALAYGGERHDRFADCTNVALLDLRSGEFVWQAKIAEPREGVNGAPTQAFLDFLGDTLLIGWDAYLITHRMSDGVQLSKHGLRHNSDRPNCQVVDLVGDHLVARCLGLDVPDLSVATIDQAGQFRAAKDFTKANAGLVIQLGRFVSTEPPVLWVTDKEHPPGPNYLILDSSLAVQHTIPASRDDLGMDDFGPGNTVGGHRHHRTVVAGQKLITVTVPYPKKANKLIAYDLTSGRREWETQVENARILSPVAVDGPSVIAVGENGKPMTIRVDLDDGAVRSTRVHPAKDAAVVLHNHRFVWADSRIYAVSRANIGVVPVVFALG